jgi:glycosyltransferase involved in cell wall biosynthesis
MTNHSFDAVVLYAVPTFGLQTLWACKGRGTPILFRALDVSHKIRRSLFSPLIKRVEALLYQKVDVLSANNPAMAKYCKELGSRDAPTIVHAPPVDLEHFRLAVDDEALRHKLGIGSGDKVIVYLGSFFYFSGLLETVKEFARIVGEAPGVKLLLIGGGAQEASLKKKVKELGISGHVIFAGFIPYASLPQYLGLSDVAINPLKPSAVSNLALPNKVLQYLSAGIPTVSTRLEGLMTTFPLEPGLFWAEDPKSVIQAATKIAFTPLREDRQEVGQADKFPSTLIQFSHHTAVSKFEEEIASMIRLKGR